MRRLKLRGVRIWPRSHLTRVDTAREQLVELDQLVWGDVELECNAVEGIIGSHLQHVTDQSVKFVTKSHFKCK